MDYKKLVTYIKDGIEVPEGTPGAAAYETEPIAPETGLYNGGMTKGSCDYRTALFVDGGAVSEKQSVTAAMRGGSYDGKKAEGMTIDSDNKHFNGIMINDTDYSVKDVCITADGSGGNDFKGYGSGIAAYGKTKADIDGYVFVGAGVVRHGVFAGATNAADKLTVNVRNSYIKANGSKYDSAAEGMSNCPWMLGISPKGHARATMCDGYATVNYESDILLCDGWGILSIDDTGDTTEWGTYAISLNVKDSVVDVTDESTKAPSAYATYSIGGCFNKFYGCVIGDGNKTDKFKALKANLKDHGISYDYGTAKYAMTYAAVVANEHASAGWYDSSVVTAKYGVMYHKTNNVRYVPGSKDDTSAAFGECGITEVKNSTFNTYGAAFLIKACTPVIEVTNSRFSSEKGVIVQLMTCDDPGMGSSAFTEEINTDAPVAADPNYKPGTYNTRNNKFFRRFDVKNFIGDAQVSFTDCNKSNGTELSGNFFNSITIETNGEGMIWWGQNLILSFDNCDVTGACSSSTALHDEYTYYTAKADNEFGGIAVNADGYEIKGIWEKPKSKGPMPDMGGMPPMGGMPDMGGMPPMGGMPDMGGMPPMGGMPDMGGMPPMPEPTFSFTPEYDENGKLIVIGKEKLTPALGSIVPDDATYLGNLTNTATPTVNNGVWVTLKNGSSWNVVSTSYLTRLCVEAGSVINGKVTVDGAAVVPEAGKIYTGTIVVNS